MTPSPTQADSSNKKNDQQRSSVEYNSRWDGYLAIALLSLIEYSSVGNVAQTLQFRGRTGLALAWGLVSFLYSIGVVVLDRTQCLADKFDYTKAYDGMFEGYALLFFIVYWIVGVAFITQVDGIGKHRRFFLLLRWRLC